MKKWSISGTCDTIKKEAVRLVSPVVRRFKKTRLSFGADGGFPYAPFYTSLAILWICVIMEIQKVLSGDGQPHSLVEN